jgi:hypothetical protein
MRECKPMSFDVDELAIQAEKLKNIESEFADSRPLFFELQKCGRKLREKGIGADSFGDALSTLTGNVRNINQELPNDRKELEHLCSVLKDLSRNMKNADLAIEKIEIEVENQKPVGGDKGVINQQISGIKHLMNNLYTLKTNVSRLYEIRYDISSKYPNADKSKIDKPLDKLNERLASISETLSGKLLKLDDALVQGGQFQDAAQVLLSWLNETKELLDSQKEISAADQNVLKAQIQEQKLLTRMFADRLSSVDVFNKNGKKTTFYHRE